MSGARVGSRRNVFGGFGAAAAIGLLAAVAPAGGAELPANDYPTVARADYVFACMQVNGQARDVLEKCACSIDKIAELLPYSAYEEAETIMSVRLKGGENVSMFLTFGPLVEKVNRLKRAQVEAELLCF
jgi:hypothetical protein